jgi:hypothetical protein
MSVEIKVPFENKSWLDKATDKLGVFSCLTIATVLVAVPVLGFAAHLAGSAAVIGGPLLAGFGGCAAVGLCAAVLALPESVWDRWTSTHRNQASAKLELATDAISKQLQYLGYDMTLEIGGREIEDQVADLNKQILKASSAVLTATKANGFSYADVLGTAYVLGNEDKRADMTMLSAAEGLLAGLKIIQNDPSAMVQPQVALHGVKERDDAKMQRDGSGPSLG